MFPRKIHGPIPKIVDGKRGIVDVIKVTNNSLP